MDANHFRTLEKGETMSLVDSLDAKSCDLPEPLTVTCTFPNRVDSQLVAAWLDGDFLCWSRRQIDAEIVVEYDV